MFRRQLRLLVGLAAAIGLIAAALPTAASAAAPVHGTGVSLPVTGASPDNLYSFAGTFDLQRFQASHGQLLATGVLTGTLTNTATGASQSVSQPVQLPVTGIDPSCQILNLTLGPLDLNLLGLMIHLNQVVLTITAQQGPGNLLGNLLCAVANLLNGQGSLNAIAQLLNQILGILSGL